MAKLVRDKVPAEKKLDPSIRVADKEEYHQLLIEKIAKENSEFGKHNDPTQLVEILQAVYAIADLKKIPKDKLEKLRKNKEEERGGFKKRLVLD